MSKLNYECIPLKWDTDYFGVNSSRINLKGVMNEKEQVNILEFSKKFDFITIGNLDNRKENNFWLGTMTNCFLVDLNIQFTKALDNDSYCYSKDTLISNNHITNKRIIEIAESTFLFSRFYNDPYLPKSKTKKVYTHWVESAFEQENKYFITCNRDNQIAGFLLFSLEEDCGVIELLSVDKNFQRMGVGKSLIKAMESFIISKEIKKIKVGTQLDNISAVRFYTNAGFIYENCTSVYHWWRINI